MTIRIVRISFSDDGGHTWTTDWSVVDADAEPCDYNYYGLLASGCSDPVDAISCAIEHGWLIPGRDA